ncbi:MAG: hypothetical protein A2498_05125 [Lentisphaerae bacterium RIFOXYC12_FULL_60_16]|nr:MAG: hypothetical protein A2498_05125 [Lentisphaerae bacterium RIFOXYC12_FULL_60_16]OGV86157.1 MAG: hypothetical protein A2340_02565 [Lentisphaerae bacterium RIFOXYB12_FULL_60_10]
MSIPEKVSGPVPEVESIIAGIRQRIQEAGGDPSPTATPATDVPGLDNANLQAGLHLAMVSSDGGNRLRHPFLSAFRRACYRLLGLTCLHAGVLRTLNELARLSVSEQERRLTRLEAEIHALRQGEKR